VRLCRWTRLILSVVNCRSLAAATAATVGFSQEGLKNEARANIVPKRGNGYG
jgi:hypothetical protein